jgi:hypothetical protein
MKGVLTTLVMLFLGVIASAQITFPPYPREITCEAGYTMELDPPAAYTTCDNAEVELTMDEEYVSGGGCAGKMIITYTYLDSCGQAGVAQVFVTLKDTQEPEFMEAPEDIRLQKGELVPFAPKLFAYDLSGAVCPATLVEKQEEDVIIRTWTAADPCGNTATHTQRIQLPY